MKKYLISGLALILGCHNQTLSDLKVYTTDLARETIEAPRNIGAIPDSLHDLRYAHPARAAENLTRIDFQRNSEPLQDHRIKASLKSDFHNLTSDFDQYAEDLDLIVEHIYHAVGLN